MFDAWTKYCQDELNDQNWFPWKFRAVTGGIIATGARCPVITRGKNKGKPNYRKADKSTMCEVIIKKGLKL